LIKGRINEIAKKLILRIAEFSLRKNGDLSGEENLELEERLKKKDNLFGVYLSFITNNGENSIESKPLKDMMKFRIQDVE
jgi:hypothetical protein